MIYLPQVAAEFDRMVTSVIQESFPVPWIEDDITYSLLRAWRGKFGSIELYDFNNTIRVLCRGYKFRGKLENRYGDIALLLSINFADGTALSGVGFLEAKRRGRGTSDFPALDNAQLRRIHTNAPRSQLLLYDLWVLYEMSPCFSKFCHPLRASLFH